MKRRELPNIGAVDTTKQLEQINKATDSKPKNKDDVIDEKHSYMRKGY